eukprot:CAMPEP_0180248236 /NCGR_PEP_ID=MMETSP0987-20121128/36605_1 /TAXON_ID=697907 /ORGANISM="non described non described, Strain CCMP2293" /LENGTH=164 /DNA_ID=CAMNT_0022216315 /DNA_START=1 /DNA_END=496 /DNA_ORIENTATION=+
MPHTPHLPKMSHVIDQLLPHLGKASGAPATVYDPRGARVHSETGDPLMVPQDTPLSVGDALFVQRWNESHAPEDGAGGGSENRPSKGMHEPVDHQEGGDSEEEGGSEEEEGEESDEYDSDHDHPDAADLHASDSQEQVIPKRRQATAERQFVRPAELYLGGAPP